MGAGGVPIALVQLSELQELTGADEYDQADQFVVGTTTPEVQSDLEGCIRSRTSTHAVR